MSGIEELVKTKPPIMSVEQAAELLNVSRMMIYRMCESGELDHLRFNRTIRIERGAIVDCVEKARQ